MSRLDRDLPLLRAHGIAAIGTRDDIRRALTQSSGRERSLLEAVLSQFDGNVDGAVRKLRALLRTVDGVEKAIVADSLAPILIMRNEMDDIADLADIVAKGGWDSSAAAFRAVVAAERCDHENAARFIRDALVALRKESNDVVRFRVLHRLALAAFFTEKFGDALDLATESAALSSSLGAWRAASASYSLAYNVHHGVTGDFEQANTFAGLCRDAAAQARDESFLQGALVAEFEIAVFMADAPRIAQLEMQLKGRLFPEQYAERFAYNLAIALVRGATDVTVMRTLCQVLQRTQGRSRGEWSLCSGLIAVACAGRFDDAAARNEIRAGITHLGRPRQRDRAYERRYRRMARSALSFACIMLGDDVRADRIMSVQEMATPDALLDFTTIARSSKWTALPPAFQGLTRIFASANSARIAGLNPAGLTHSELEVLRLLNNGWSAGRIAAETGRSVNTVYSHTRSIFSKLDVSKTTEAISVARRRGVLD